MSPLTFRLHLLSALIFDVLSFNFKYKAEVEIFHTLGIFLLLFLFSPTAFISLSVIIMRLLFCLRACGLGFTSSLILLTMILRKAAMLLEFIYSFFYA